MWGTLFRIGARYAFFRRYRNFIIVAVALFFCIIAAILIDANMNLSAGLTGLVGLGVLGWLTVGWFQVGREIRERERQKREKEAQRAAAAEARAQARSEAIGRAKATVSDAARTATTVAANATELAKTSVAGIRDRLGSWSRKGRVE